MSEYGDDNENGDEAGWLKKLRKAATETKKENEELKQRLADLESKNQFRDINRAFASRGVDPRVAKFYAGDGSDESIDKWIEENDELLGLRTPKDEASEGSTVKASDQEAFEMMRQLANTQKLHLDLQSRMEAATSQDELMAIVAEARGLGVPDSAPF